MYQPQEVERIKEQRRKKQLGIDLDTNVDFSILPQESQDDPENEDGILGEFEPFNMTKELAEGYVNSKGDFTSTTKTFTSDNREFMKNKQSDAWIDSANQDGLESSKRDREFYAKKPKRVDAEKLDVFQALAAVPTIDIIKKLISKLQYGQTPIEALKNKNTSTRDTREENDKQPNVVEISKENLLDSLGISELSHAITMIWQSLFKITHSIADVYYQTREEIQQALMNFKTKGKPGRLLEFKWVNGDGKVYGPSTREDIIKWIAMVLVALEMLIHIQDYISDVNTIVVREVVDGTPTSEDFINLKESFVYTEFDRNSNSKNNQSEQAESDDSDDCFAPKHRKSNLIGIRKKDAPINNSDDESDYEQV
ncbi:CD2 antigen cytoplasmic tail-binding protein 2-Lin1 [Babesia duncani]|uniref:CD2 antigen cytoplasmic tail-binding protein 2-Lin1 n=1 Tax=Babesia duncani TaxID=323732 RepID=A0AAD9PK96_9APIC|nr:CD2 antigen cytoplasmic tail-binding protein 2-Lin1 [Babesia duncani]